MRYDIRRYGSRGGVHKYLHDPFNFLDMVMMALLLLLLALRALSQALLDPSDSHPMPPAMMPPSPPPSSPFIGAPPRVLAAAAGVADAAAEDRWLLDGLEHCTLAQVPVQALLALVCWLRIMQVCDLPRSPSFCGLLSSSLL